MHLAVQPKTQKYTKGIYSEPIHTPTITPYVVNENTDIVEEVSKIATDELSEEQLLNWSVRNDESVNEAQ